jgi:hypothetical protein
MIWKRRRGIPGRHALGLPGSEARHGGPVLNRLLPAFVLLIVIQRLEN